MCRGLSCRLLHLSFMDTSRTFLGYATFDAQWLFVSTMARRVFPQMGHSILDIVGESLYSIMRTSRDANALASFCLRNDARPSHSSSLLQKVVPIVLELAHTSDRICINFQDVPLSLRLCRCLDTFHGQGFAQAKIDSSHVLSCALELSTSGPILQDESSQPEQHPEIPTSTTKVINNNRSPIELRLPSSSLADFAFSVEI